eukprot:m.14869 g.14869  ORF g.14869 m.14869 type:complete len:88 (-) comp7769_c0_seq2:119-382(-)
MFTFGGLLQAILLVVNGIAILQDTTPSTNNSKRPVKQFLAKMGWTRVEDENSLKGKIITMINSVRTILRVPLIIVNIVVAAYLLVAG